MKNNTKIKIFTLIGISLVAIVSVFSFEPICQDLKYHTFADGREIMSVPNFWNVISNLPFLFIGGAGMFYVLRKNPSGMLPELKLSYFIFFLGMFFTGIGSGYYHLAPHNESLVWDRLPMTIAFMSFFSIIIGENINVKTAKWMIWPLILIGFISVFYWAYTEGQGCGDLRMYALVQFLPIILIPLIMSMFPSKFNNNKYLWFMLLAYAMAKVFEATDSSIFEFGHLISGHTIKHFFAATAPFMFLRGIIKRTTWVKII